MEILQSVTSALYFYPGIGVITKTLIPHYGNTVDADNYFTRSLRSKIWREASQDQKVAALTDATRLIDSLNYVGNKTEEDQPLQFPRTFVVRKKIVNSNCTEPVDIVQSIIPKSIETACYEIAFHLLDGFEPDMEIENLGSLSQGIGGVRDTYSRDFVLDHIRAGIPSAKAWSSIKPYLIDPNTIRISRVD